MAMTLSAAMVMGLTPISAAALTTDTVIGTSSEIISFEKLSSEVSAQNVPLGTYESELNLPETLMATVQDSEEPEQEEETGAEEQDASTVTGSAITANYGDEPGQGEQQDADGADASEPVTMDVTITWTALPEYDGDAAGEYIFTPELPEDFTLADGVKLPAITVTVEKAAERNLGEIIAFDALADEIRWQNTTSPDLPETVSGTVEGISANIPVTWEADHEYEADSPEKGLYVFTARPGEGYSLTESVEAPRITAYVPAVQKKLMRMAGSGTSDSALVITTAAQLAEIATLVNDDNLENFLFNDIEATVYLTLGNDIDLSAYGEGWNNGKGWIPIGGLSGGSFKGTFDGNGNTIIGLYINDSDLDCVGLFGNVVGGTVQNLGVEEETVSGHYLVGGVVGAVNSGSMTNCYTTGAVSGTNTIGGVVGAVNSGSVTNCYATCAVSGTGNIGGVVGSVWGGNAENCYATGAVSGTDYIGGVAGHVLNSGSMTNCVALNPSVSGGSDVGRVAGLTYSGNTLSGNAAFSGMTGGGNKTTADGLDGSDITTAQIKADGTLDGQCTTKNGWTVENGKLPGLGETVEMPDHIVDGSDSNFRGEGTQTNPYQISTPAQLTKLAKLVNAGDTNYNSKYYKLTADIDLSGYGASNTNFNSGKGWVPIGNDDSNAFQGTFDGNGNTITELYINDSGRDYAGLFGYVNGGTVQNLGVAEETVSGASYVSGVAGFLNSGSVENCYATGSVSGSNSIGGVVGFLNSGSVTNCYATGAVSGTSSVGGVAGYVDSGSVTNCYATGAVNGSNSIGGVAGYVDSGSVTNCASLNPSVSGIGNIRRVAGVNYSDGTLSGNVAFSGMTGGGNKTTADGLDGADITAAQIKADGTLGGRFTTENGWTVENGKFPILTSLAGQDAAIPYYISGSYFGGGDGSSGENAYEISTAAQLAKLAELVNAGDTNYNSKYYKLTTDIDLSGYGTSNTDFNSGKGWVPIGKDDSNAFRGTFDGNGNTITELDINDIDWDCVGLFGYVKGGTVQNLGVEEETVSGRFHVGGVAGYVDSSNVTNCYATGVVTSAGNCVGGVAGSVYSGSVTNCYATCAVTCAGYVVGGVAGYVDSSSVTNCYATGVVAGVGYCVGGVAGYVLNSGSVTYCAVLNPSVSGSSDVGRVVGFKGSGALSGNAAFSGMTGGGNKTTADGLDGADLTIQTAMSGTAFWKNSLGWDDTVWTITDDKLPTLKNVGGTQSSDGGLYLTDRDIQYANVTVNGAYTYDGSAKEPDLTVTFEGKTLVKDQDYSIKITSLDVGGASSGINAGTVTLKLVGIGNFKGEKTGITYVIAKKEPTSGDPSYSIPVGHTYTGSPQGIGSVSGIDGLGAITVKYGGSITVPVNAGTYTVTVDLADGTNYLAANGLALGSYTIERATVAGVNQIYEVVKNHAQSYFFDLTKLLPSGVPASQVSAYAYKSYTNTNSIFNGTPSINEAALTLPIALVSAVGLTDTVTIGFNSSNYDIADATVTVKTAEKTSVSISADMLGCVYNGQPPTYRNSVLTKNTDHSEVSGITPQPSYEGVDGTIYGPSSTAPINAGTYKLTLSVPDDNILYTGSQVFSFTIEKRQITVRADEKSMDYGGTMPAFTYTIDGQIAGETALTSTPVVICTADGKTSGSYDITVNMTGIGYTDNYKAAEPESVKGTLTVSNPSYSGGSSDSSSNSSTTTTPEKKPNQPVTGAAEVTAAAGTNGKASAAIPDKTITEAISKAQSDAKAQGKIANGIGLTLNVTMPQGATSLSATLSQNALQSLVNASVVSLEINGAPVSINFDLKALKAIQSQSRGNVTVTITPVQSLSGVATSMISTRPVYNVTLSYVKDGKTYTVPDFDGGIATISIPYTPVENEAAGYLYGVYVDGNGKATRISGSAYDSNSKCVIFTTTHFSVYGVGYTVPSAKFTDISKHWAKESIDYVVGRGLFAGTSNTTFSPDKAMTRGMLVTALGRLAGADVSGYKTSSFTDVKVGSTFQPYIEWAYKKGFIQGIGNSQFAPDRAITREEIAVILTNYAKATGYTLPITREVTDYADTSSIGSACKEAVKAMQQAGIMIGGNNNKFIPKSSATRAEVSAMLYRYIKLTIDPATAQSWAKNDSGQYIYFKDGKTLTGWQTIDGKVYCFDRSGGAYANGWKKNDKDEWFFLSADGSALVGWLDIGANGNNKCYYFTKDASMVFGKWLEIDGKWYYFYTDGSLAVSTKINGYELDENGVRKTE